MHTYLTIVFVDILGKFTVDLCSCARRPLQDSAVIKEHNTYVHIWWNLCNAKIDICFIFFIKSSTIILTITFIYSTAVCNLYAYMSNRFILHPMRKCRKASNSYVCIWVRKNTKKITRSRTLVQFGIHLVTSARTGKVKLRPSPCLACTYISLPLPASTMHEVYKI